MALQAPTDLNHLRVFATVAETGGFTAAAERLGTTKAKVSIEVRRLEAALGASLFTRTTRRVVLTEAGRRLYESCSPLLRGLGEALAELSQDHGAIAGSIKISATVDHGGQFVAAAVAEFARLHPGLRISLCLSDHVTDMVAEGIDLAFRVGWLRDSTLRATRLGEFEQYVVAAPDYLREHGTPASPQDLAGHQWIALNLLPTPLTWQFSSADGGVETVRMSARLQTDSPAALRSMLLGGAGVSVLYNLSVSEDLKSGRLQRLLPDWTLPRGGIYVVYPPGRHIPASVRSFVEFYRARLERL